MHPRSFDVLRCLADGEFHSGARLAAALGVSRTTVWQAVRGLEAAGQPVYCVRGRGYRLQQPASLLSAEAIAAGLAAAGVRMTARVAEVTDSTNRQLLEEGDAQAGPVCLFAEHQTAGRGRRGRRWLAPPAGALLFSVAWRFAQGAQFLAGLSLAIGVAVADALHAAGVADVGLKWPNDIQRDGRKLAGILIEMQGDLSAASRVVIGIGLNVRLGNAAIDQPAADLADHPALAADRNRLAVDLLVSLARTLDRFGREGFAPFRDAWQQLDSYRDAAVCILMPDGSHVAGRARGVTETGLVRIETPDGLRVFASGDVSLREDACA